MYKAIRKNISRSNRERIEMKKILIIIPYFGKFPNYFKIWLKSVEYNKTIDFLLITDNKIDRVPSNVKLVNISFEQIKKIIQNKYKFNINLKVPYDLCKFKPAYGDIFEKYINGYDFWGHCDMDLVFGDLRHFFTDSILENNQKILSHGHLCLYKNEEKINKLYKVKRKDCYYYKDVYSSKIEWNNFDEYPYGISRIAKMEKIKVYEKDIFADLDSFYYTFRKIYSYYNKRDDDVEDIIQYFSLKKGKLINYVIKDEKIYTEELAYVHFQKRIMNCELIEDITSDFDIFPNVFLPHLERSINEIIKKCDLSKNEEYCKNMETKINNNKKKVPMYKKFFSYQRIKRKLFLIKMDKIYNVKPYKFEKGGF